MAPLSNTTVLAIAGVVVFILLVIGAYLARSRLSGKNEANENSGTERLTEKKEREDYSIPLRSKYGGMPLEAKAFFMAVLLAFGYVSYEVYAYLKTGSPTQMAYTAELQFAIVTVVGIGGGIWFERRRTATEGKIDVFYEANPENGKSETTVRTVHFDTRDVLEDDKGTVVFEYSRKRLWGLFRIPRRIGQDRKLRAGEIYRPMSDKIGHRIPSHALEVATNHYVFYTKGDAVTKSPSAVADYEYKPPWSLSNEQYVRHNEDMDKMQTEVEEKRSTLAHKDKKIRKLETALDNALTSDWRQFMDVLQQIAPFIGGSMSNEQVLQRLPEGAFNGRSARDGNGNQDPKPPWMQSDRFRGGEA